MIDASCVTADAPCADTNMTGHSGEWVLALQALVGLALVALIVGIAVFVVRSRR